jgi:cobalt-zinc-cadmium efflux system outer membrane protein
MHVRKLLLHLGTFPVLWVIFCGVVFVETVWAEGQYLKNEPVLENSAESLEFNDKNPTGVVTLKHALTLVLMNNPELKAFSLEVRALEARALQAGLFPNPEIDIEGENFGGSGEYQDTEVMETTIQLSQLIELGGKRSKRKQLAILEQNLGTWDYKIKRIDVLTAVTKAFVEVLATQNRLSLTEELVGLAQDTLATVSERVKAGKVSPLEETRSKVAYSIAQIDLERAKRSLEGSRRKLAAAWGSKTPMFEKVEGRFFDIVPVPSAEKLEGLISQNPEIERWISEMDRRRADLELAKATGIPDVTLSGGVRRFNENDDNAFVFGVSIPLPIFNRNQGGILEASRRLAKAGEERRAVELKVIDDLAQAYESLSSAFIEATALKRDVLPGAQSAFEASREGYRHGKFDYLAVLDAQRTLFETRSQYIEVLNQYHQAVSEVERLIGTGLDTLAMTSSSQ